MSTSNDQIMSPSASSATGSGSSNQQPWVKLAGAAIGTRLADVDLSLASLRLGLAVVVFPHGAQKLLGWFGGYGFEGTMNFFTQTMGIPAILALGVILVEFFAPLFLLTGLFSRIAALAVGTVMTVAMFMVHIQNGFFMNWYGNQAGEGVEYFLLIIALALGIIAGGSGKLSLDNIVGKRLSK